MPINVVIVAHAFIVLALYLMLFINWSLKMFEFTNQESLRRAFFDQHPTLPNRRIRDYSGKGLMYPTDTRCAWVDWIDYLESSGSISSSLANRATLER
jgi:hypothetical protein